MRALPLLFSALALAAAACGDDGGGSLLPPTLIPGGGVHDPGIAGVVNVFAIDGDSGQPVAGATVAVGGSEGTTDATGLVVVEGVTGPQTIAIKAPGYATTVWVGVDGGNVTVPIDRTPAPTTPPPQAQLSGSITGWSALPAPGPNFTRTAFVSYSQDRELGSRANQIAQPPSMGLPPSVCSRPNNLNPPCMWRLNVRAGAIALGVMTVDVDDRGTGGDPTDDAIFFTGFSATPITVEAGRNQPGVMVDLPPADSGVRPTVDVGTPPAALTQVTMVVGLDLGAAGILRFAAGDPTRGGAMIPSLALAPGSTWELVGVAREPVADGTAAQSVVIRRGFTDPAAFAAGAWLAPPTGLASDRATVSFTRSRAEGPYVVELDNAALGVEGRRVMSIVVFDASSQVPLPAGFAPLPADPMTMTVTTLDPGAPLDLRDFEVDALTRDAVGFAADTIKLP